MINGNATEVVVDDKLQHLLVTATDINILDVLARCHHLFSRFVAKADNALQHTLFILDVILIGEFKRLLKVIHTQLMTLFWYCFLCDVTALDEDGSQWPKEFAEEEYTACRTTAEL